MVSLLSSGSALRAIGYAEELSDPHLLVWALNPEVFDWMLAEARTWVNYLHEQWGMSPK